MTAIPAKIAKVPNIMICVPSQDGETSKLTLAAAYLCGVNKVYNVGGAQAIAAFAFGTKLIKNTPILAQFCLSYPGPLLKKMPAQSTRAAATDRECATPLAPRAWRTVRDQPSSLHRSPRYKGHVRCGSRRAPRGPGRGASARGAGRADGLSALS